MCTTAEPLFCSIDHKAIKLDESAWQALPPPRKGELMETYDDDKTAPTHMQLRNCVCTSTLYHLGRLVDGVFVPDYDAIRAEGSR